MNIYVSHNGHYDYENELYRPLRESGLFESHHLFLPHEPESTGIVGRDELKRTDLLVAEVSYPSTGQGVELGWADVASVPIVCFYKAGAKPSGSLRFVSDKIIEYQDVTSLLAELKSLLR